MHSGYRYGEPANQLLPIILFLEEDHVGLHEQGERTFFESEECGFY